MNYILKKIVKYTIIAAAFFLILNVAGNIFSSSNKNAVNGSVEILKSGSLKEEIPTVSKSFEKELKYSGKSEMLEHYEIRGKCENKNIYGYVQIWKTDETLERYLELSKKYMSRNVYGFTENEVKIEGISWCKWEYIVNGIYAAQAFSKINDEIYLCSLFVPYQERTYGFDQIFAELLKESHKPLKPIGQI